MLCSSSLVLYPRFPRSRTIIRAQLKDQEDAVRAYESTMLPRFSRRLAVGVLSSFGLALGANFAGVTSFLLGLNPGAGRNLRLDVLYPVEGFFRYYDLDNGYEFIYPQDWLRDQTILYRAIEKTDRARSLIDGLPPIHEKDNISKGVATPSVAFGPPGTSGELNVSVILAPIREGFMIDDLGDAEDVGSLVLSKFIAPKGSNKHATLIHARRRELAKKNGPNVVLYTLEYTVEGRDFFRHNVSVYTTYRSQLYSLNVQVPENQWLAYRTICTAIADSFNVFT